MSKKTEKNVNDAASQAARLEEERRKAIAEFNVQNMGKYWIDPDKVPTSEDIENVKKEFEERTKALQEKKDYLVADKSNALRVAKFMKDFNDNSVWSQRMFVGVLNFSALMNDFIENFDENNPKDLIMEYAPMQYAFLLFENYGGVGIDSARHMAEIWDEYLPIYETLHELVDWYKNEADKCDELKEKWAMFEQGYYLHILEGTEEDPRDEKNTVDEQSTSETKEVSE
jgi:predicted RNA-binding protein with EMAP domain